jgi:hypothetical protein
MSTGSPERAHVDTKSCRSAHVKNLMYVRTRRARNFILVLRIRIRRYVNCMMYGMPSGIAYSLVLVLYVSVIHVIHVVSGLVSSMRMRHLNYT